LIVTPDAAGLFAKLAGTISSLRISIQDAKAFTTQDGVAFDVFYIQDWDARPLAEEKDMARLKSRLEAMTLGRFDPAAELRREAMAPRERAFAFAPQVIIDNQASDLLTVIEVDARDRPGLLYDLSRTLAEERLRISSAHIATFGAKIVDVFYVKDLFGLKLSHPARLARVKARLLEAAAGGE
jgi:[protein-PII] uridylyltransferase